MQNTFKLALIAIVLVILSSMVFAISADEAVAIVSTQNNYLISNETAVVSKEMISYNNEKYVVVAAQTTDKTNAYIPIKNSTSTIATQDVEIRELIKTTIIYTKLNQLNLNTSTADWPFSYSTKSYFTDLANDFSAYKNSAITVQTELNKINDSQAKILAANAAQIQTLAQELADESNANANSIEKARLFEQDFFNNPDTNKSTKYETYYKNYFVSINNFKDLFNQLDNKSTILAQGIGALETNQITIDQKRSFQALLTLPINTRRLPNFFSSTDQLRTIIEGIFNEAKNSENFATTLASRKVRNEAWKVIYGRNEELLKLNKSFNTLESAANAILSADNVDLWENQDAVDGLKSNWSGAQTRFTNAEYEKAKNYALAAITNVKQIIGDGVKVQPNNTQDLLTKGVVILIVAIIVIFVIEKLILNKKKKEEDLDEPEYK